MLSKKKPAIKEKNHAVREKKDKRSLGHNPNRMV